VSNIEGAVLALPADDVGVENAEERGPVRRRILKAGIACFNGRHSTLPCTVRDLSDTGARVRSNGSINVPDTFELHIELDGLWANCEVIWRRGEEIGVRFTEPPVIVAAKRKQSISSMAAVPAPSLRRVPKK
jgi:hypothetical protein